MREEDNFAGAEAAYKRLVDLAVADNAGPVRRVARDLTFLCREHIIGMACADLDRHPDDFAIEMVKFVCIEENEPHVLPSSAKADGLFRVKFNGKLTTPEFNSHGAASAYLDMLVKGTREPEYG